LAYFFQKEKVTHTEQSPRSPQTRKNDREHLGNVSHEQINV